MVTSEPLNTQPKDARSELGRTISYANPRFEDTPWLTLWLTLAAMLQSRAEFAPAGGGPRSLNNPAALRRNDASDA